MGTPRKTTRRAATELGLNGRPLTKKEHARVMKYVKTKAQQHNLRNRFELILNYTQSLTRELAELPTNPQELRY